MGSKRTIILSLYASAVSAVLVAVSPSLWSMGVFMLIIGLAAGLYHPAGLAYITRGVRQPALGLGLHGVAGNVGVFATPALAIFITGLWNWRIAFLFMGGLCAVAGLVFQSAPRDKGGDRSEQGSPVRSSLVPQSLPWDRNRFLLPLLAVFAVNLVVGFVYRTFLTYLPLHLQENLGIEFLGIDSVALGGYVATFALIFGALGQYVGGRFGERYRREFLLVPLAVAMVPVLVVMGLMNGYLLIIAASFFAFFNFMAQPSLGALIADYTPRGVQGRMFGIMFLVSAGMGSLGGVSGGWVAHSYGVEQNFILLGIASLGTLALVIYLALASVKRTRLPTNAKSIETS